jgi:hypothetical protein
MMAASIGRRELIAAGVAGLGLAAAAPADACSFSATRLVRFSDPECRRQLEQFVALLNEGPQLSDEAIADRTSALGVNVDGAMIDNHIESQAGTRTEADTLFFKQFRLSAGRPDPRPIRLAEARLLHRVGKQAVYQFTLERYSYHPADPEGCNGIGVHDEYYGVDRSAHLATFISNRLYQVKEFPEWPLEPGQ